MTCNRELFLFLLITYLLHVTSTDNCERNLQSSIISVRTVIANQHICAGALIAPRSVLTTAVCVYRFVHIPTYLRVAAGVDDLEEPLDRHLVSYVDRVDVHPNYVVGTDAYDVAVVHMLELFPEEIKVVGLTDGEVELERFCGSGLVGGWGGRKSEADLAVLDSASMRRSVKKGVTLQCRSIQIKGIEEECSHRHPKNMSHFFCGIVAASEDGSDCFRDNGGPVICNNLVVGIVCCTPGCIDNDTRSLFTRVDVFSEFLQETISDGGQLKPTGLTILVLLITVRWR